MAVLPLGGIVWAALGEGRAALLAADVGRYAATSAVLSFSVAAIAGVIGTATAWASAMYRFPGSRWLGWALALPLAVPGFALAYAYADMLDVAGPLRSWTREAWGFDISIPIRSVPGAAFVLGMAFYPYVFLAMRAAFLIQSIDLIDAARMLGAGSRRVFWRVALPVARPALAAGMALAAMETLAEYGAVQFLSVQTLTTGIVRAWSVFGSTASAARLALPLLAAAALLLWIERHARSGAMHEGGRGRYRLHEAPLVAGPRGWGLTAACALPLVLGLILPAAWLGRMAWLSSPDWARLADAATRTAMLAGGGAVLTVLLATMLALGGRRVPALTRMVSLGYATPGAVMAIGLLAPAMLIWRGVGQGMAVAVGLLLLAYAARLMAAAYEPIEAGLTRVAPSIGAAARMLGRGPSRAALAAELPLVRGTVLTALLLVFVDIAKELPATLILRPFDFDTLAVIANNYALDERLGQAAWPSLLVLTLCLPPVILLSRKVEAARPGG